MRHIWESESFVNVKFLRKWKPLAKGSVLFHRFVLRLKMYFMTWLPLSIVQPKDKKFMENVKYTICMMSPAQGPVELHSPAIFSFRHYLQERSWCHQVVARRKYFHLSFMGYFRWCCFSLLRPHAASCPFKGIYLLGGWVGEWGWGGVQVKFYNRKLTFWSRKVLVFFQPAHALLRAFNSDRWWKEAGTDTVQLWGKFQQNSFNVKII